MDKITCPNCGTEFDVEEALSGKIQEHYKQEYEKKLKQQFAISKQKEEEKEKELELQKSKLEKEREEFLLKKEQENKLFAERVEKEKEKLKKEALVQSEEEVKAQLKALQEENEKRKEENNKLKDKELELLKQQNLLKEQAEDLKRKTEKELLEKQNEIEEKAKAKERESFELEKQQLLKQIEDNKKLAEEMKRKAEQGSMQLQGEVQELAIEDLLAQHYPYDTIKEVPKGIRGADCIQEVFNSFQQNCGSIVYESKRTKNFSKEWIDKLKQDQQISKADIAILVTQTMPPDMIEFGEKEGVWICQFHEVASVSAILRQMLIKVHATKSIETNKGEKKELLYQYFSSNEFKHTIRRIVDNQNKMREQLAAERRSITKIWAAREKQIWSVEENIASLFGSITEITGRDIEGTDIMKLPEGEEET